MSTTRSPEKGPSLWGWFLERIAPRGERRSAKEAYGTWLLGQVGIGVAAGTVVAANVGAKQRFEYTVIGEPVNEAARLCELAKSHDDRLLASFEMLHRAGEHERALWSPVGAVTLRGHDQPTQLAHLAKRSQQPVSPSRARTHAPVNSRRTAYAVRPLIR